MIIGLTGKRLSGKDTAGAYLVDRHGFTRIGNADKMKDGVAALFGITREQVDEFKRIGDDGLPTVTVDLQIETTMTQYTFTWVEFLQRFGTEMGRKVWGWDFWVDMALPNRQGHRDEDGVWNSYYNTDIVVTDVRFENEAQRILDLGGTIVELQRPSAVDKSHDDHESEAGLSPDLVEYVIENNSTLESLYQDLDAVLENIHANTE